MTTTALDPVDQRPVRAARAGSALVPGHLAWRRLGVGHRAETWLTWSQDHWSPTVVKLPRPDQLAHPRARATLRREAEALRCGAHPGLPRLLEDRHDDDVPCLVLEWIDGPALDELLAERGALPPGGVLALAAQLAAVLRWLHRHGIAHLDLTPGNVVIRDGWPTVIDLGAARPLGAPVDPGAVGTAGYCAPELEAGRAVTASMDLYGLGAVLRVALDAPAEHPLAELVRDLLDPDPHRRPADADELLARLSAAATADTGPPWPPFAERRRRLHVPRHPEHDRSPR